MKYCLGLCILPVLSVISSAWAADNAPHAPTVYQSVMRAQYAAHSAPHTMQPEEAQRIYETYLRSIGQPIKDHSTDAGDNVGAPAH